MNDDEKVVDICERIIKIKPKCLEVYSHIIYYLKKLNKIDKVKLYASKIIELDPYNYEGYQSMEFF